MPMAWQRAPREGQDRAGDPACSIPIRASFFLLLANLVAVGRWGRLLSASVVSGVSNQDRSNREDRNKGTKREGVCQARPEGWQEENTFTDCS